MENIYINLGFLCSLLQPVSHSITLCPSKMISVVLDV